MSCCHPSSAAFLFDNISKVTARKILDILLNTCQAIPEQGLAKSNNRIVKGSVKQRSLMGSALRSPIQERNPVLSSTGERFIVVEVL